MWQCPLCQSVLTLNDRSAHCNNQHTFDRAKSGYLNLLPVQFKKSRHPGDDKTMLRARQTFHASHGYLPLMQRMASLIEAYLKVSEGAVTLFDAGCGEGTYLNTLSELLGAQGIKVNGAGCDIAKLAVDIASKAYKPHQFVVASSANLPVQDASIDVMLQVFAPGSEQEQARVLRDTGMLVTVDPGPDHLCELKARVYDTPRQHPLPKKTKPGFHCMTSASLRYTLTFSSDAQRQALLTMTPYWWRVAASARDEIARVLDDVTADFVIQLWQRDGELAAP
ncbi:putative RNA methyltransferase [Alteromonas halophila]|uniref:23S rRNA (Guanine(745)-N(1))-methyltransferase n=1 Tax=Alteromonas halophila TaxID=516698 RepID=A0A918JLM3_9ALTE|nr:methyltransferase domain-containing protein [Alteromonas halophila]GGW88269.1 23S rRNA (guanine(745)-N(1))-methyltransferase [Alteromonas halophila]